MDKSKLILVSGACALVIALAAGWYLGLLPGRQVDTAQAEQLLASGIALFDEEDYAQALEVLERVPAGSPQEARARYYQGSAHMMLKDFDAATQALEQALVLDPRDTGTLYALGVVYYKLGNLKLAKGYFSSVLEINPGDEHAKGLMDIMARLERQQPAESAGEAAPPGSEAAAESSPADDSGATTPPRDGTGN